MGGEKDLSVLLLEAVSKSRSPENNDRIKELLEDVLSEGSESELNIVDSVTLLLHHEDTDIKSLAAQCIAELSKCDENRPDYARDSIIIKLLAIIDDPIDENNIKLIKQACRALGNICCDSFEGRDLILKNGGISKIIKILPKTMECNDDIKVPAYSVRLCTCKLLLNFILGGTNYILPALDADFINNVHRVLRFEFESKESDDCVISALLLVSVVVDNIPALVLDRAINLLVVQILKDSKNIELSEMCLEHLHAQGNHDNVKAVLSSAAVPQLLWSLLEQHRSLAVDEETRQLMKLACDLIVLILTGDESMHLLYAEGKGELFLAMVGWLDSDDVELVTTAVLAVGNFARTEEHCVYMMDSGVFSKLLSLLSAHKSPEEDIRLQHALLSGLRNLVIPQRNKPLAIQHGILPIILEMLPNVTQYHVVYKLLATLRMLVDGQESVAENVVNSGVLEQVCRWGTRVEHAGAAGEAPRLLAWIVRQLHSRIGFAKLIEMEGCVGCLVNMLVATHPLMQNEALMALSILCSACLLSDESDENVLEDIHRVDPKRNNSDEQKIMRNLLLIQNNMLIEEFMVAQLGKQVNVLIESNIPKMMPEIAENISKFLTIILKCNVLAKNLYESNVHLTLDKLLLERGDFNNLIKTHIQKTASEIRCKND